MFAKSHSEKTHFETRAGAVEARRQPYLYYINVYYIGLASDGTVPERVRLEDCRNYTTFFRIKGTSPTLHNK